MATQVIKQSTNYSVSTSNDTLKLDGNFNVKDNNRIDNYYANINTTEGTHIGSASYSEYGDGNVSYQYNCTASNKASVIELVDASIVDIKTEFSV